MYHVINQIDSKFEIVLYKCAMFDPHIMFCYSHMGNTVFSLNK